MEQQHIVDLVAERTKCSICLQTLQAPRKTPCKHTYCLSCISLWLANRPHCPICRAPLSASSLSMPDDTLLELLGCMWTSCPNDGKYGCPWKGPHSNLQDHVKICVPPQFSVDTYVTLGKFFSLDSESRKKEVLNLAEDVSAIDIDLLFKSMERYKEGINDLTTLKMCFWCDTEKSEELKSQGNDFFKSHLFEKAIQCYTKSIELDGTNFYSRSNRSLCYSKKKDYENALKDAEVVMKMAPKWIKSYGRLLDALLALDRTTEASNLLKEALQQFPDDPNFLHLHKHITPQPSPSPTPTTTKSTQPATASTTSKTTQSATSSTAPTASTTAKATQSAAPSPGPAESTSFFPSFLSSFFPPVESSAPTTSADSPSPTSATMAEPASNWEYFKSTMAVVAPAVAAGVAYTLYQYNEDKKKKFWS